MAFLESQGSTFFWDQTAASTDASTAAGALVGQIVAINGPSGSAGKIDVTNLGSTAKQFLMGIRDEGDISIDVIYDPDDVGQAGMFTDRGTRTLRNFLWRHGSTTVNIKGFGYCTGFSITGAVDDALKATFTVAITGAVEATTGTTVSQNIPDNSS